MQLLYPDYIKLLKHYCEKRRFDQRFSSVLVESSPAKLRDECLTAYEERYERKDAVTLEHFFGPESPQKTYRQIIKHFDLDKFKPLANYLRGQTESTEKKNIELLAWLIDFPYRPYGRDVILSEEDTVIIRPKDKPDGGRDKSKPTDKRNRLAIFAGSFLVAALAGTFFVFSGRGESPKISTDSISPATHLKTADFSADTMTQEKRRCEAITQKGTRCKRNATQGNYCKQHSEIMKRKNNTASK